MEDSRKLYLMKSLNNLLAFENGEHSKDLDLTKAVRKVFSYKNFTEIEIFDWVNSDDGTHLADEVFLNL